MTPSLKESSDQDVKESEEETVHQTDAYPNITEILNSNGFHRAPYDPNECEFKKGLVYRGVIIPNLTNSFKNKHLEMAYQRYSSRQRQKSLIIVNVVGLILKVIVLASQTCAFVTMGTISGCLIVFNVILCVVSWWRCFANNYLHWVAIATWIVLNVEGNIIFFPINSV